MGCAQQHHWPGQALCRRNLIQALAPATTEHEACLHGSGPKADVAVRLGLANGTQLPVTACCPARPRGPVSSSHRREHGHKGLTRGDTALGPQAQPRATALTPPRPPQLCGLPQAPCECPARGWFSGGLCSDEERIGSGPPGWYEWGHPPVCTPNLNVNPSLHRYPPHHSPRPPGLLAQLPPCGQTCRCPPGASSPGVSPKASSPWTELPSRRQLEQRGPDLCTTDINAGREEAETFRFH